MDKIENLVNNIVNLLNDPFLTERTTEWHPLKDTREKFVRQISPLIMWIPDSFRTQFTWDNCESPVTGVNIISELNEDSSQIRFYVPALPPDAVALRNSTVFQEATRIGAATDAWLDRLKKISIYDIVESLRTAVTNISLKDDETLPCQIEESSTVEFKQKYGSSGEFIRDRLYDCLPRLLHASEGERVQLWVGVNDAGTPQGLILTNNPDSFPSERIFPPLSASENPSVTVFDIFPPTSFNGGFKGPGLPDKAGIHNWPVMDRVTMEVCGYTVDCSESGAKFIDTSSHLILPRKVFLFGAGPSPKFSGLYVRDWQRKQPHMIGPLGVFLRLVPLESHILARLTESSSGFLRFQFKTEANDSRDLDEDKFDAVVIGDDTEQLEIVCDENTRSTRFAVVYFEAEASFRSCMKRLTLSGISGAWDVLLLFPWKITIPEASRVIKGIESESVRVTGLAGYPFIRSCEPPHVETLHAPWFEVVPCDLRFGSWAEHSIHNIVARAAAWLFPAEQRQSSLDWDIIEQGFVVHTNLAVQVKEVVLNALKSTTLQTVISITKDERAQGLACGQTATLRIAAYLIAKASPTQQVLWITNVPTAEDLATFRKQLHSKVVLVLDSKVSDAVVVLLQQLKHKVVMLCTVSQRVLEKSGCKCNFQRMIVHPFWNPGRDVEMLIDVVQKIPFAGEELTAVEIAQRKSNLERLVSISEKADPLLCIVILSPARGRYECAFDWVKREFERPQPQDTRDFMTLLAFVSACTERSQDSALLVQDRMIALRQIDLICVKPSRSGQFEIRFIHPYLARLALFVLCGSVPNKDPFPQAEQLLELWKQASKKLEYVFGRQSDKVQNVLRSLFQKHFAFKLAPIGKFLVAKGESTLFDSFVKLPEACPLKEAHAIVARSRVQREAQNLGTAHDLAKSAYEKFPEEYIVITNFAEILYRRSRLGQTPLNDLHESLDLFTNAQSISIDSNSKRVISDKIMKIKEMIRQLSSAQDEEESDWDEVPESQDPFWTNDI